MRFAMLNICITFDYELFFGKNNGTDREILFDPTAMLVDMLAQEGVSATFFADTCSITRCKKLGRNEYVRDFTDQISNMHAKGQDVQLHIHSHWLKSDFQDGQWNFDSSSYRLQSFGFDRDDPESASAIIREGKEYLELTLQKADPEYRCIAYRAGGFAIQPHKELVAALYENGIRIDSSVAPKLVAGGTNSYDFTAIPKQVNWHICSEGEWNQDLPGGKNALLEIPIATENKNPIAFLLRRVFAPATIKLSLGPKRGSYINIETNAPAAKFSLWNYISCYNAMSMDAYQAEFLYSQLKRFKAKHCKKNADCAIALIGHPKLVTKEYISNLQRLIQRIREDKDMQIQNVVQAYNNLKGECE